MMHWWWSSDIHVVEFWFDSGSFKKLNWIENLINFKTFSLISLMCFLYNLVLSLFCIGLDQYFCFQRVLLTYHSLHIEIWFNTDISILYFMFLQVILSRLQFVLAERKSSNMRGTSIFTRQPHCEAQLASRQSKHREEEYFCFSVFTI